MMHLWLSSTKSLYFLTTWLSKHAFSPSRPKAIQPFISSQKDLAADETSVISSQTENVETSHQPFRCDKMANNNEGTAKERRGARKVATEREREREKQTYAEDWQRERALVLHQPDDVPGATLWGRYPRRTATRARGPGSISMAHCSRIRPISCVLIWSSLYDACTASGAVRQQPGILTGVHPPRSRQSRTASGWRFPSRSSDQAAFYAIHDRAHIHRPVAPCTGW